MITVSQGQYLPFIGHLRVASNRESLNWYNVHLQCLSALTVLFIVYRNSDYLGPRFSDGTYNGFFPKNPYNKLNLIFLNLVLINLIIFDAVETCKELLTSVHRSLA